MAAGKGKTPYEWKEPHHCGCGLERSSQSRIMRLDALSVALWDGNVKKERRWWVGIFNGEGVCRAERMY